MITKALLALAAASLLAHPSAGDAKRYYGHGYNKHGWHGHGRPYGQRYYGHQPYLGAGYAVPYGSYGAPYYGYGAYARPYYAYPHYGGGSYAYPYYGGYYGHPVYIWTGLLANVVLAAIVGVIIGLAFAKLAPR